VLILIILATIQSRTFCLLICCQKHTISIYKTIILPVVLCGCETWFLTLREEHRLRVFENRVLRRIFGLKMDLVMGVWRDLWLNCRWLSFIAYSYMREGNLFYALLAPSFVNLDIKLMTRNGLANIWVNLWSEETFVKPCFKEHVKK
jgi:hypothetical protein